MTPYTTLWHCLCSHLCPLKVLMPGRNLIESEGDSPVSPVEMRVAPPSRNKSGENFQSALVFRPFQLAISLYRGAFSRIVSHWMTAMELMSGRKLFPSGKASHQYLSSAFCGNPLGKSINCKDRPSLQDVRLDFRRGYEEEEEKQQWESGLEDGDSDLEDTSDWLEGDSEDDCYSSDSEDELDLDSDCDWEIQPVVFKVCASPVEKESFLNKGQNSQSDLQATEHEDKVEEDEDEDDDSDWSDNSEESDWDDDSETNGDSKRNLELWESFFHSDDPYNPLGFSAPCRMGQDSRVEKTEMGTETPELRLETEGAKVEDDKEEPRECKHKKVRFSLVVQVHHLPECAFDDHAARSGACWEEMARDRLRFQRRVQQISEQIDCCLQSSTERESGRGCSETQCENSDLRWVKIAFCL